MSTWLERARKMVGAPSSELTKLPKAPFVSFGSESTRDIRDFSTIPAEVLERFATGRGIDWTAAYSQMIEGDVEAGGAQLAADSGDGVERSSVACWMRLLAERATPAYEPRPNGYRANGTGLDAYGRPLPPARASVTCGSCQNFQHDPINPPAGAGICGAGVAELSTGPALHPMAPRWCDHHSTAPDLVAENLGDACCGREPRSNQSDIRTSTHSAQSPTRAHASRGALDALSLHPVVPTPTSTACAHLCAAAHACARQCAHASLRSAGQPPWAMIGSNTRSTV